MKKILPVLILFLFIAACGETYDEGPEISFRSALNRLVGTWKVEQYLINGADSTLEFNDKIGCEVIFSKEIWNNGNSYYFYFTNCNNGKTLYGFWNWWPHSKKEVVLHPISDSTFTSIPGPFWYNCDIEGWYIIRLTANEFHARTFATAWWGVKGSTQYDIYLQK
jgi:hypothetical protein